MNDELPEGWASTAIGVVADVNPRHPRDLEDDLMVAFVPMPAVSETDWTLNATQERPLGDVRTGYTHFAEGDVLFAKITPCMENGKAAIATSLRNGLGCGTTELHVLRPRPGIDAKYLYHFIHQEAFRREAAKKFTGTAGQLRVPVDFIRTAELPVPSSAEQRRIVAQIEALFDKVRTAQERLDKIPTLLKRFRQGVLSAACSGKLTADWRAERRNVSNSSQLLNQVLASRRQMWEHRQSNRQRAARYPEPFAPDENIDLDIPEAWSDVTISQLALLDVGFAFKSSEFVASGIRLLRGENVEPGRLRWTETKCWPEAALAGFEHLLIERGEIILALDRPLISSGLKIARATKDDLPCLLVQRVMRFKMGDPRVTEWVYYNLQIRRFIEHLATGLTGTDLPHVTGTGVAEFKIGLPPIEEQEEITRRIEAMLRLADRLEARYAQATAQVDKLAQSVLAKAFRGELVTTEAALAKAEGRSYETAAQLLKRISESPNITPTNKRSRVSTKRA